MSMSQKFQCLISVIAPTYNEAENIGEFLTQTTTILDSITNDWEILFIDDGSKDATIDLIKQNHKKDKRIKYVIFSRNFGKEAALTAGLKYAKGQVVIPMDVDLQDPPSLIPQLYEKWKEGYKVVLATRKKRDGDSAVKKITASLFYRIIGKLSQVKLPENTGDFRLMDIEVVEAINTLPERTRFMKGIFSWVGFDSCTVYYERNGRYKGSVKQNYKKLWNLALDGIFSFSTLPLQIWMYLGSLISLVAFGYTAFLILRAIIFGIDVPGYTSLMTTILFMGGIQLISLGVMGQYISRIYNEVKSRPIYVISQTSQV